MEISGNNQFFTIEGQIPQSGSLPEIAETTGGGQSGQPVDGAVSSPDNTAEKTQAFAEAKIQSSIENKGADGVSQGLGKGRVSQVGAQRLLKNVSHHFGKIVHQKSSIGIKAKVMTSNGAAKTEAKHEIESHQLRMSRDLEVAQETTELLGKRFHVLMDGIVSLIDDPKLKDEAVQLLSPHIDQDIHSKNDEITQLLTNKQTIMQQAAACEPERIPVKDENGNAVIDDKGRPKTNENRAPPNKFETVLFGEKEFKEKFKEFMKSTANLDALGDKIGSAFVDPSRPKYVKKRMYAHYRTNLVYSNTESKLLDLLNLNGSEKHNNIWLNASLSDKQKQKFTKIAQQSMERQFKECVSLSKSIESSSGEEKLAQMGKLVEKHNKMSDMSVVATGSKAGVTKMVKGYGKVKEKFDAIAKEREGIVAKQEFEAAYSKCESLLRRINNPGPEDAVTALKSELRGERDNFRGAFNKARHHGSQYRNRFTQLLEQINDIF